MGLNATLVTLTANTIAHAADVNTSLTNLNAVDALYNGTDTSQVIGHNLHGSTDSGISNLTHSVVLDSPLTIIMKFNNYWDGTNDRFGTTQAYPAYQLSVNGAGIAGRKSNANGTANAIITWLAYTYLFT